MKTYDFNEKVPAIDGIKTYSIKLDEGGFANINTVILNGDY